MLRSRITIGFHRLGIVLAVPLVVLALGLAVFEWENPSGPLTTQLPKGVLAYSFANNEPDTATQQVIDEQRAAGLNLPNNFMLVGLAGKTIGQDGVKWHQFELWDGREIGIATDDKTKLGDIARKFLLNEKINQHRYTDKDNIEIDTVPVKFLNWLDQALPEPSPWLVNTHQWTWPLIALSLAALIYIAMWALGWVISGFSRAST